MILVIDNYDSFVHTLARYIREEGYETNVIRHDQISLPEIRLHPPDAIVLSPGPGKPTDAGICLQLVRKLHSMPILGVCLGHQVIVEVYGGRTLRAEEPVHGSASAIYHQYDPLFLGMSNPFDAGRYHSLIGALPATGGPLERIGWLREGTVMAVRHRIFPHVGVQFHPESLLTPEGRCIIRNFLSEVSGR